MAGEELLDTRVEIALQPVLGTVPGVGLQSGPADERLALRARLPPYARRFVAPDMDVFRGEECDNLFEDLLDEFEDGGVADAEDVAAHARLRGDGVGAAGASERGIGCERRGHVAGHIYFGYDLDVSAGRIIDDVADLLFGVVAAEGPLFAGERRVAAESAGPGQFRVGVDFDAPPLVVGQVPVEDVEVVERRQVDDAPDLFDGVERAADIEHEAPVAQVRPVGDAGRREEHFGGFGGAHGFAERLQSIENARVGTAVDGDAALRNLDVVVLGALAGGCGPEHDGIVVRGAVAGHGDGGRRAGDRFDVSGQEFGVGAHSLALAGT